MVGVLAVNLFGIREVSPSVVDAVGGAPTTFVGVGLPPVRWCGGMSLRKPRVDRNATVRAQFHNQTELVCESPRVEGSFSNCDTMGLRIQFWRRGVLELLLAWSDLLQSTCKMW